MQQTPTETSIDNGSPGATSVVRFTTGLGLKIVANAARLSPQSVTFELHAPEALVRLSEKLNDFEVEVHNRSVYRGEAVVSSLMNIGTATACEVSLPTPLWGLEAGGGQTAEAICEAGFTDFLKRWQNFYRVNHEYKAVIADLQTLLSSLRLWLEQVELTLPASSSAERKRLEIEIAQGLRRRVTPALANLFERFEEVAEKIDPELLPVHRAFGQRQLHSHLLCAPFIHRTYAKPLGYAGDYEMMNMIVRNGLEGPSLYAKLVNAYLLDQAGPQAVRNRVNYLQSRIGEEACRAARLGRPARIYNLACGPVWEVANFLAEHPLAERVHFDLLDFDAETLAYAGARMEQVKKQHHLKTPVQLVKKSVQQVLRASTKSTMPEQPYDMIYSSGLYDYLNDRVIKALNTYLYDQLQPGGLLTVGNFAPNLPVRNFIEHFLEWFLIFRNAEQLAALAPSQASPADCRVVAEPTGTNLFLEVRKPL